MSNKATIDVIQKDWKEREMIEVVHLNILKVSNAVLVVGVIECGAIVVLFEKHKST